VSQQPATSVRDRFIRASSRLTGAAGSPFALVAAVSIIVIWALTGPIFNFSETWQLIINTGTTIITFLMVFVIQASANRDNKALHLKLDEVIRAVSGARNELIGAEQATEEQIREREAEFLKIAEHGGVAAITSEAVRAAAEAAERNPDVRRAARSAAEREVGEDERTVAAARGNGSAKSARKK
jgi:low affinity Fe/Cu permease